MISGRARHRNMGDLSGCGDLSVCPGTTFSGSTQVQLPHTKSLQALKRRFVTCDPSPPANHPATQVRERIISAKAEIRTRLQAKFTPYLRTHSKPIGFPRVLSR